MWRFRQNELNIHKTNSNVASSIKEKGDKNENQPVVILILCSIVFVIFYAIC